MSALSFGPVFAAWPALLRGAGMTLLLTVTIVAAATPCGVAVAVGRDRGPAAARVVLGFLSWIVRGLPPLLILMIVFFMPPDYGIELPPFAAAVTGLGLYMTFIYAEVFRAGFAAVPPGTVEAARALGLRRVPILWRVVLPQALRAVLAPFVSHTASLLKNTVLATVVGVREVTSVGKSLFAITFRPLEVLLLVALFFAAVSAVMFAAQARLEHAR